MLIDEIFMKLLSTTKPCEVNDNYLSSFRLRLCKKFEYLIIVSGNRDSNPHLFLNDTGFNSLMNRSRSFVDKELSTY